MDHSLRKPAIAPTGQMKKMNSSESEKVVAATGGDTVKLVDFSSKAENHCIVAYSPSPGYCVNSVKWNHNNMVLASAGDDGQVSFWKRNGTPLSELPCTNDAAGMLESITISFCNKGSRYLCSGGTGQVVRIWDLQSKRCIKWLKGHTDTITGLICNCKDDHIASLNRKGEVLVHSIVSGARVADLKDPHGQVLVALDYSRISRHLLATSGDDGSIHLWDTTCHTPKASWPKQHSAPSSGVNFSPPNDKIIASVGLDMKLYTFDTGSKKPSSCIHHEAPFSSLAYSDDGLSLAAGTTTGQIVLYDLRGKPQPVTVVRAYENTEAVTSLCWQRSKPATFNERSYTDETILLAGDVGDTTILPDPLPSKSSAMLPMTSPSSRNPSHVTSSKGLLSSSSASVSASSVTSPLEQSDGSKLLVNRVLAKLHAPHSNIKDDMEVFSPIVEVEPFTPHFDRLWDNHDGPEKDKDGNPGFVLPSRRFGLGSDENPIFNLGSSSSAPKQVDITSPTMSQSTSNLAAATRSNNSSSAMPTTPRKPWGDEKALEKFIHRRQAPKMPSRFSKSTPPSSSLALMPHVSQTHLNVTSLHGREASPQAETSSAVLSAVRTKNMDDTVEPVAASPSPRRFSSYAERVLGVPPSMSLSVASPKSKKTGLETREEILNNLMSPTTLSSPQFIKGGETELQKTSLQCDPQQGGKSYVSEETLASFQESIHGDMKNLHLEILRQFHMQEMGMSSVMRLILENQAEIMDEIQSLREQIQHLHQLL